MVYPRLTRVVTAMAVALLAAVAVDAAAPESKRLIRARDYIADEQWVQAIELLRAAVDDAKEPRRDEALYWLAHSQHHSGDSAAAVATISRLEREFPSSMWVRPAQSLRIDIAVRLGRHDVLLWTAMRPRTLAPTPVPAESAPAAAPKGRPGAPKPVEGSAASGPVKVAPRVAPPSPMWYAEAIDPDPAVRVQALNGLIRTDADVAIPLLAEIAKQHDKPRAAGSAMIVLAQSPSPKARAAMLEVTRTAPEPVQKYAVRALAGFGGPRASDDLMQVYVTAKEPVKFQIVKSLGDLEQPAPLMQIVRTEKEGRIKSAALLGLARAGAVEQLAALYTTAGATSKRSIIDGFVSARADAQLIRVCDMERKGDPALRKFALERLKLFDTDRAREYLRRESLQTRDEKR